MLIPLGEKARLRDILEKLDILFGDVSDNGMIMQKFLVLINYHQSVLLPLGVD